MRQIDLPQLGQCVLFNSQEINSDNLQEMLTLFMGCDSETIDPDVYTERLLLFIEILFPADSTVPIVPGSTHF
jgi:hypothetical protein